MNQSTDDCDRESSRNFFFQRITDGEFETFKKCTYIYAKFKPYAALQSLEDDDNQTAWAPYRGQPYDESQLKLIPGGWDHEHCDVCTKRIEDGDWYWASSGLLHVDFCADCYKFIKEKLK